MIYCPALWFVWVLLSSSTSITWTVATGIDADWSGDSCSNNSAHSRCLVWRPTDVWHCKSADSVSFAVMKAPFLIGLSTSLFIRHTRQTFLLVACVCATVPSCPTTPIGIKQFTWRVRRNWLVQMTSTAFSQSYLVSKTCRLCLSGALSLR